MESREISYEDLLEYVFNLKEKENLSLNDFIQEKYNLKAHICSNLSKINFDNEHRIDLTGANLTNCILDNVDFNGKFVVLKNADLKASSFKGTKFTNAIDLEGTDLGNITLDYESFEFCILEKAIYTPVGKHYKLTEEQILTLDDIKKYISQNKKQTLNEYIYQDYKKKDARVISNISGVKIDDIPPLRIIVTPSLLEEFLKTENEEKNINSFLKRRLALNHENIIADLSGQTISEKFSNRDLSGSIIKNCSITGKIENLELRDCVAEQLIFQDCHLISTDLRGTSLSNSQFYLNFDSFDLGITLENPILSTGTSSVNKLKQLQLLPLSSILIPSTIIVGEITADPYYLKGSNSSITHNEVKISQKILEDYIEEVKGADKPFDFSSWYVENYNTDINKDQITYDFTGLNLSNLSINGAQFKKCNFTGCNFLGTKISNTSFESCNLSGSNFSSLNTVFFSIFGKKKEPKIISDSVFLNCNMECSTLNEAKFQNTAILACNLNNIFASKTSFNSSIFEHVDLTGSNLQGILITGSTLSSVNFNSSNCTNNCNFSESRIVNCDFTSSNLSRSVFKGTEDIKTSIENSSFHECDLKSAVIENVIANGCRFNANIKNAIIQNNNFNDCDIQFKELPGIKKLKNNDFDRVINSYGALQAKKAQITQQIKENEEKIYKSYSKFLIAGAIIIGITLSAAAPLVFPAFLASTISSWVMLGTTIFAGTIAIDRFAAKCNFDPGFSKQTSKILGAGFFIKKSNAKHFEKINDIEKKIEDFKAVAKKTDNEEESIKANTESKYREYLKNKPLLPNSPTQEEKKKKSFAEKVEKKASPKPSHSLYQKQIQLSKDEVKIKGK